MPKNERRAALAVLLTVGLVSALFLAASWHLGARSRAAPPAPPGDTTTEPSSAASRAVSASGTSTPERTSRAREVRGPSTAPPDRRFQRQQRSVAPSAPREVMPAAREESRYEPSTRSETRGELTFENTCSVELELFWVDFEAVPRWYGYVGRGSVVTMPSFEGHRWVVRERGTSHDLATGVVGAGAGHLEVCAAGHALRDPTPPPATPPGGPPSRCTTDDGPATTLFWTNTCAVPVALLWVDRTCERRPYRTLAPGASAAQSTYVGHVWRAETPDARVLFEQPAAADAPHWILRCDAPSSFTAAP